MRRRGGRKNWTKVRTKVYVYDRTVIISLIEFYLHLSQLLMNNY